MQDSPQSARRVPDMCQLNALIDDGTYCRAHACAASESFLSATAVQQGCCTLPLMKYNVFLELVATLLFT